MANHPDSTVEKLDCQILLLRKEGLTFKKIADILNLTVSRCQIAGKRTHRREYFKQYLRKYRTKNPAFYERLKLKVGNLAFEQVISVAKQKHKNMLSNDFSKTLNCVLGSCQSLGILVDSKEIKDIMIDVNNGEYDALIKAEKTDVSPEKVQELKDYFTEIKKVQDAAKAASEAEAAAAAEKPAEETSAKPAETPAKKEEKKK